MTSRRQRKRAVYGVVRSHPGMRESATDAFARAWMINPLVPSPLWKCRSFFVHLPSLVPISPLSLLLRNMKIVSGESRLERRGKGLIFVRGNRLTSSRQLSPLHPLAPNTVFCWMETQRRSKRLKKDLGRAIPLKRVPQGLRHYETSFFKLVSLGCGGGSRTGLGRCRASVLIPPPP